MPATSDMIPGTVRKGVEKFGLIVMSARTIPFRTAKIARVSSPKFMRTSFFLSKAIPSHKLAITAVIANTLKSQSGMLRKLEPLDIFRKATRANKSRDTASGVTKLVWCGSDCIHSVTELAERFDAMSFERFCVLHRGSPPR